MSYFGNASRQLLESLQGVRRIHLNLRKLELVTKIMFGYYGNNKSADFYQDFSENQQFYIKHAKLVHFSFVLSIYTECGNKVAWNKDVLRYQLLRKYSVSKINENS